MTHIAITRYPTYFSDYFVTYPNRFDAAIEKLRQLIAPKTIVETEADCLKKQLFVMNAVLPQTNIVRINNDYPSLNKDKEVIKKIIKYYYKKIKHKYLKNKFSDLYGYLEISDDNKVSLIKNLDEYKKTVEPSYKDLLKTDYLTKRIINKDHVSKLLKMFVKRYKIKWYKLGITDVEEVVIKFMHKKLKEFLKKNVERLSK